MNTRKGMSQVLALIVAAAVLMMTALTVIFLTQGSLGNFGQNTRGTACTSTIETQCRTQGWSGSISPPGSCFSDGEATSSFSQQTYSVDDPSDDISCSTVGP